MDKEPTYEWGVRFSDHQGDEDFSITVPYNSEQAARDVAQGPDRYLVRRLITDWEDVE